MSKMLGCKTLVFKDYNEIETGINNWILLNQEKNVRFITQSYIPIDRTPVNEEGKYEETRAFHLYTIFFEGPL